MNHIGIPARTLLPLALAAIFGFSACSKKVETPAAAPTPPENVAAPAPAAPSATAASPAPVSPSQYFAEADAAMKAAAYDKAAKALLAAQAQRNMSEQQAMEARNRMVGLQRSLAQAAASGDPNAKAAIELLRQSSMR